MTKTINFSISKMSALNILMENITQDFLPIFFHPPRIRDQQGRKGKGETLRLKNSHMIYQDQGEEFPRKIK